jgi:hypothetical protein
MGASDARAEREVGAAGVRGGRTEGTRTAAVHAPRPTRRSTPHRRALYDDEAGLIAGAEALVFGVLVFLFGTLVVVGGWAVIDAKFATSAAAREAVRAAVEADAGADLAATGRAGAVRALAAHGVEPSRATILLRHGRQERCAEVRFEVGLKVPLPVIPSLGGRAARVPVTSTYAEVIDPYRAGLPEGVSCAF